MDFYARRDSRNADFEGYRPYERFFDCVAERTGKRSEEIALGHFAQNEAA
jgi:hypothetical protein